jgi:hypothetical protein
VQLKDPTSGSPEARKEPAVASTLRRSPPRRTGKRPCNTFHKMVGGSDEAAIYRSPANNSRSRYSARHIAVEEDFLATIAGA